MHNKCILQGLGFTGTLYGFGNILLMMWFGYGGYKHLPMIDSNLLMVVSYLVVIMASVYLPLWFASKATRRAAIIGLLPPWVILIIIALPQKEVMEMVMLAGSVIACLVLTRKPIENSIEKIKT
jgi:hypothetical protein